jgi:hypothetical protein
MQTVIEKTTTREDFITALRSGDYKQCYGNMKDTSGHLCAMGVFHAMHGDTNLNDISISFKVRATVFSQIADMNDTGSTFQEIANYVEGLTDDEFYSTNSAAY